VKLNEFKQLNELDLAQAFGDYGAAALQQTGSRLNPFNKTGSDQLSVQDKMAKNIFLSKMIGRASADLDSAIKGGLVDPSIKGVQPTTTSTQQTPTTQQAPAGETPEQKRIRLQKAAQQNIDKTAAPVSKLPVNQPTVQAGNIRQAKQKDAAANAQSQMSPVSKLPANQTAIQAANIRKQKQQAAQANLFKESTYTKLDYILESVINIDEAVASKQSISDFIQRFFKKYLQIQTIPSQVQAQVTTLANEIESTYPRNKDALTKLANLGYAFSYSNQDNATDTAGAGATQPATSSFAAGIRQGLGKGASASDTTAPATSTSSTSASTEPTTTVQPTIATPYKQAIGLLGKLDKKGKQRILSYIEKQLGNSDLTNIDQTITNRQQKLATRRQTDKV